MSESSNNNSSLVQPGVSMGKHGSNVRSLKITKQKALLAGDDCGNAWRLSPISSTASRYEGVARDCSVTVELSLFDSAAILEAFSVGLAEISDAEKHQLEVVISKLKDQITNE